MLLDQRLMKLVLRIIKTPTKPIKIATHVLGDTFSFNIIADSATTITGASDPML